MDKDSSSNTPTNVTRIHQFSPPGELRREIQLEQQSDSMSGSDAPTEERHPLQDIIRILLVYRKLIATTSLVVLVFAIIHAFTATPLYTATASVSIGSYSPSLQGSGIEASLSRQTEKKDYLETQIRLFSRLTLADKVLSDPRIGPKIKAYLAQGGGIIDSIMGIVANIFSSSSNTGVGGSTAATYAHPVNTLKAYLSIVGIEPIKRTFLVNINVTTSNPELSSAIANAHAENFIRLTKEEKRDSAIDNLLFLREQANDLAKKVAQVEGDLAQYAEENAIVALNEDENIVLKKMGELNRLLTAASTKRIQSEATLREIEKNEGAAGGTSSSDAIDDLRGKLRDAEAEYADLGQKFKPTYPAMKQLKAKIRSLEANIKKQQGIITQTAKAEYEADLASEKELMRQLEIQKSKTFDLSRRSVKYNTLKREYESLRDLHQTVLRQLKEVQLSSESDTNNITLADRAATPDTFSSPKRKRNILMSLLLGPLLGFMLAFALEVLNDTFETSEQVQQILKLPSLGIIPSFESQEATQQPESLQRLASSPIARQLISISPQHYDPENDLSEDSPKKTNSLVINEQEENDDIVATKTGLVTVDSPFSASSEAFRSVRTSILLSSADNPPRTVLVTSSRKGEGKTTLSSNLALTIAGTVKSAIIIDCDLRRSALHKMFGVPNESPGLVNYLTGLSPLEDVIYPTAHERLSFIPAGIRPPNPAELLGSHKMEEFVHELKERFEFVLLDSPPILPVTDSVLLSKIVDGVVFVVRGQNTEQNIAKEAKNKVLQVGGRILGVVLNGVDVKRGQQYYYYRDAYAEYYDENHQDNKKKVNLKFWKA